MSIKLYDDAITNKIQSWILDPNLRLLKPDESTRFFQMNLDLKNDEHLTLPLIALSRDKTIDILEITKQPKTYSGFAVKQNEDKTIPLNAIPIKLSYQLDIYCRYMEEADEYLRNFVFNLINYPSVKIEIPYNDINYLHESNIQLEPVLTDNSDIREHLISDQFTRFTIRFSINDAYMFSAPIYKNWKFNNLKIDVMDRTDKDIVETIELDCETNN